MAIVKIKPIKSTISKTIDYIIDDKKTDNGVNTIGYEVAVPLAGKQFKKVEEKWKKNIRSRGKEDNEILGYHLVQSFDPKDDITEERAMQIGEEFAKRYFGEDYQFVIATHNDKNHIHNHIVINAFSFKGKKKYFTVPYKTIKELQKLNDEICRENGLMVIEKKEIGKAISLNEFYVTKRGKSYKKILQMEIDYAIEKSKTFEEFLKIMKEKYEIKQGKHIAFRRKNSQDRFTRAKTIGEEYSEEIIRKRIERKDDKFEIRTVTRKENARYKELVNSLKDIRKYESILDTLNKNKVESYDNLVDKLNILKEEQNELRFVVKKNEKKIEILKEIIRKMKQYNDNKDVYLKYKKTMGKAMYEKYTSEIMLADNAKKYLENYQIDTSTDIKLLEKKLEEMQQENEKIIAQEKATEKNKKELEKVEQMLQEKQLIKKNKEERER